MEAQADSYTSGTVDRRRFLKRAGAVAWLTPAILTLSTKAAYASHCKGNGDQCGDLATASSTTCLNVVLCCTQCDCTPSTGKKCRCTGGCGSNPI